MNILEIIEKKKNKIALSENEIKFIIEDYIINKNITDYQMSSLLMAMNINGLNIDEISSLTKEFLATSKIYKFKKNNKNTIFIDKHSSGGVGDKVTIILTPILISLGYNVPKISGRGLGHTGGTIDKLESIGVKTNLKFNDASKILSKCGAVIMEQTNELVPADKKIYSLRDVTGNVDCMGLIVSSILSKKFVINSDYIFLDLKVGSGAIIKNLKAASKFAKCILSVCKKLNRKVKIMITSMEYPIGKNIGNFLEIKEAVDFLKNNSNAMDLKELIENICIEILMTTNKAKTKKEAIKMYMNVLESGDAYKSFEKWIKNQGGKYDEKLYNPKYKLEIKSKHNGFLNILSAEEIGNICIQIGAGRIKKEDIIDMSAGIIFNKQSGEKIDKNDVIATLYSSYPISKEIVSRFNRNISILGKKQKTHKILLKCI